MSVFALSRDGEKVFLHQPDAGMVVPVLLDLEHGKLSVRVPSVDELENDYAVYDEFGEMFLAVDRDHRDQVDFARKFSRECSRAFREQLSTGKLTVSALRNLVEGHLQRVAASQPQANSDDDAVPTAAEFARYFSAD